MVYIAEKAEFYLTYRNKTVSNKSRVLILHIFQQIENKIIK